MAEIKNVPLSIQILSRSYLDENNPPREGSILFYKFKKWWWFKPIIYCGIFLKQENNLSYFYTKFNNSCSIILYSFFLKKELNLWTKYDRRQYNNIILWQPIVKIPECRLRLMKDKAKESPQNKETSVAFVAKIIQAGGLIPHNNMSFLQCQTVEQLFQCLINCGY